jgi:DNA polymerase III subunit epsilon
MWYKGPLGFLDFETTGVDLKRDRPVSYAVGIVEPNDDVYRYHRLVDAGVRVPREATAVHGVTRAQCKASGVTPIDMLNDIATVFERCAIEDIPVVIMNAGFDWPMLNFEHQRAELAGVPVRPHLLDPLVLDRYLDRYRKTKKDGGRNLTNLVRHYLGDDAYEEFKSQAHDALADCVWSVKVMRAIALKFSDVRDRTPRQLMMPQRKMHRIWSEQMAAWRRERGEEPWAFYPWPGWPYEAEKI